MHVFMTVDEAAALLKCDRRTVTNRIRRGVITNVITNGCTGTGVRYIIDMTKEFGIEEEARNDGGH